MQNLARFRTTLKFGGEYLRNGWRYSKSELGGVVRRNFGTWHVSILGC